MTAARTEDLRSPFAGRVGQALTVQSKRLALAVCAAVLLQSCATKLPAGAPVLDLASLKASPEQTLALYEGKRIRVGGFYLVDHIDSTCWGPGNPVPQGRLGTYLDLRQTRGQFDRTVHRWIVMDATVRKPKDMRLGGGDLYIEVGAHDQDFYLDDARLVAVDYAKPICR